MENLEPSHFLNLEQDGKLHVLFGGTKVVQHTPPSKSGPGMKGNSLVRTYEMFYFRLTATVYEKRNSWFMPLRMIFA